VYFYPIVRLISSYITHGTKILHSFNRLYIGIERITVKEYNGRLLLLFDTRLVLECLLFNEYCL